MFAETIPAERLEDCMAVTTEALTITRGEVRSVVRQTGGLFNFVLRVETARGSFFFKQYLDDVPNPIFDLPRIPATSRAQLACDVQRLAAEATRALVAGAVPEILRFDRERSAFLMGSAAGERPLIDFLSRGQQPSAFSTRFPWVLAALHQATYGKFADDSNHANTAFRDFKLRLQYDAIAARLPADEAAVVLRCREHYQTQRRCVTHGDINSRNILAGSDTLGVIDFEQSHLGSPAYDLAYILCEVLISLETFGAGAEASRVLGHFLDRYFERFHAASRESVETELTQHLAIQTLYRFWGPSRDSWTFYVEGETRERIIARSRALLMQRGPVVQLLKA